MKSFGPLLRKLRGSTPRKTVAARAGLPERELALIESGRTIPDPEVVARLLEQGLGFSEDEVERLLLEVQLFDYGLKDDDVRQLVIDVIERDAPPHIVGDLKRLYRSYASSSSEDVAPPTP